MSSFGAPQFPFNPFLQASSESSQTFRPSPTVAMNGHVSPAGRKTPAALSTTSSSTSPNSNPGATSFAAGTPGANHQQPGSQLGISVSGPGLFSPEAALRFFGCGVGGPPGAPPFPPFLGRMDGLMPHPSVGPPGMHQGSLPEHLRGLPPGLGGPLGMYPGMPGPLRMGGPHMEMKSPDGFPGGLGPAQSLPGYYYNPAMTAMYPYDHFGNPLDINGARRKNATRETTAALKTWLYEHRKNPYPTKGEKIMLAIISKMTLTQVSTWFANARRRLKKENKMTWSPRNRTGDDEDRDEEIDGTEDGDVDLEDRLTPDNVHGDSGEGQTLLGLEEIDDSHRLSHTANPVIKQESLLRSTINAQSGAAVYPGDVASLKRTAPTIDSKTSVRDHNSSSRSDSPPPAKKPKIWSIADTLASEDPPASSRRHPFPITSDHGRPRLENAVIPLLSKASSPNDNDSESSNYAIKSHQSPSSAVQFLSPGNGCKPGEPLVTQTPAYTLFHPWTSAAHLSAMGLSSAAPRPPQSQLSVSAEFPVPPLFAQGLPPGFPAMGLGKQGAPPFVPGSNHNFPSPLSDFAGATSQQLLIPQQFATSVASSAATTAAINFDIASMVSSGAGGAPVLPHNLEFLASRGLLGSLGSMLFPQHPLSHAPSFANGNPSTSSNSLLSIRGPQLGEPSLGNAGAAAFASSRLLASVMTSMGAPLGGNAPGVNIDSVGSGSSSFPSNASGYRGTAAAVRHTESISPGGSQGNPPSLSPVSVTSPNPKPELNGSALARTNGARPSSQFSESDLKLK